ncbi:MAG TPA: carboxypeptidase-like regulatory domain-containing protein [Patescibacteria group bacterium]|nr:carboxypeptidase-like regulatory domain-containing protein [Patescibacteria group bacterium]
MKTASGARPAFLLFLLALTLCAPAAAQSGAAKEKNKNKKADDTSSTFLVIRVVGGKTPAPVPNASVYLNFQEKKALHFLLHLKKKVELDLKTDNNGYASFPELPRGKLLIQVVADGWKPFGEYYSLKQPRQTIRIKLQRPKTHWY